MQAARRPLATPRVLERAQDLLPVVTRREVVDRSRRRHRRDAVDSHQVMIRQRPNLADDDAIERGGIAAPRRITTRMRSSARVTRDLAKCECALAGQRPAGMQHRDHAELLVRAPSAHEPKYPRRSPTPIRRTRLPIGCVGSPLRTDRACLREMTWYCERARARIRSRTSEFTGTSPRSDSRNQREARWFSLTVRLRRGKRVRRSGGRGRRCRCWGGAAWTWRGPRSGGCARG